MSKYEQTLAFLFEQLPMYQRQGKNAFKKDLTNIYKLCKQLDNPQNKLKCVHVAGTNGKGSTVHILSAILQHCGYRVGVYTSPHYADFRERIKINTTYIPASFVTQFVEDNSEQIEQIEPSFFEITVAMAFQYFADQSVDIALIETGLGGRLDSTNIISPIVSIITNIGMDHMDMLGDTIAQIAYEKAGIIKPKIPAIIGTDQNEAMPVFRKKCLNVGSPLFVADRWVSIKSEKNSTTQQNIDIQLHFGSLKGCYQFTTDMTATYQLDNIRTSLASLPHLQRAGFPISMDGIERGLENVKKTSGLLGRWDIRQIDPIVIYDSAHNEDGIQQLLAQLSQYTFDQIHFIYGTVLDKDVSSILKLLPSKANYYLCKANIPRGKDVTSLSREFSNYSLKHTIHSSVKEAFNTAMENASKNDIIIVAGSIFVVAELV